MNRREEITGHSIKRLEDVEYVLSGGHLLQAVAPKTESCLREVMLRLPQQPYEDLFDTEHGVWMFNTGSVDAIALFPQFPCPFRNGQHLKEHSNRGGWHRCRLIVLSPRLERRSKAEVTGVIAHELAHAYLWQVCGGFKNEREAYQLAFQWGFQQEIRSCGGFGNRYRGSKNERRHKGRR